MPLVVVNTDASFLSLLKALMHDRAETRRCFAHLFGSVMKPMHLDSKIALMKRCVNPPPPDGFSGTAQKAL